jgi:hypothetical protein
MNSIPLRRFTLVLITIFLLSGLPVFPQSRPQRPDPPKGNDKKNQRPRPKTPEELKK